MGMVTRGVSPIPWGGAWLVQGVALQPVYASRMQQMAEHHRMNLQQVHARNLIEAERFEDAAKIYDGLGKWKEAGEARRASKRTVVTQVQVDVNSLIEQVRKGGLITTYSCPACHSPIQISGSTDLSALSPLPVLRHDDSVYGPRGIPYACRRVPMMTGSVANLL